MDGAEVMTPHLLIQALRLFLERGIPAEQRQRAKAGGLDFGVDLQGARLPGIWPDEEADSSPRKCLQVVNGLTTTGETMATDMEVARAEVRLAQGVALGMRAQGLDQLRGDRVQDIKD